MVKPVRKSPPDKAKPARPLLMGKITVPVASRYRIQRSQISERVFNSIGIRLVLIRAPAGFGKTSAMLQLRERYQQEGTACCWLNLDDADNDPPRFLTYFGLALQGVLDPAPGDEVLTSRGDLSSSELAVTLMDRIGATRSPFVIFMDEFERLRNPALLDLIARGIERLPPGAQLVIGSRRIPDVGMGRLRARGQLLEIDPAQLRFSAAEAGEFLTGRRGLSIAPEQVQRLHRSTEGWAAALWLASVALERRPDPEPFIAGFTGSNADIAEYLAEDVLGSQPDEVHQFLLQSSILDRLTPALCDAVCVRTDSEVLLDQVERANLFLTPTDESRSAWCYHSLFLGFLRETLRRTHPEWIPDLHRRAAEWYLREDRPISAIHHAFDSGDQSYALDLLSDHAETFLAGGRMRLLTRWLDAVPRMVLAGHPRLRTIHAWAVNFTRGPREALQLIEEFEPSQIDDPATAAQLLALRPMLLGMTDRVDEGHRLGVERQPLIRREFAGAYSMLAQCLANTHMILGHFAEARHQADEARQAQAGREAAFHAALAESVEGTIDLMQGRLRQATIRLRAAAGVNDADPVQGSSRNAFPGVLLAEALYESGASITAERMLEVFVPMVRDLGLPDNLINAHVLLARILHDRGETDAALQVLAALESTGQRLALPRVVASTRLERARALIASGDFAAARDQIEQSGDASLWQSIDARFFIANDLSTQAIARVRWMIRSGAAGAVIADLRQLLEAAEREHRNRRALKLRILLAEALHRDNQRNSAMRTLARALEFAANEGFVQTFLEEGPGVQALLGEYVHVHQQEADLRGKEPLSQLFTKILQGRSSAGASMSAATQEVQTEPFTAKQMQVLELLGQGYSNNAIAEKLFVSESTVRTHLRTINIKLGAGSRTQALVIARRLKLIA